MQKVAEIRSKHGIILDCSLEIKSSQISPTTISQVAKKCANFCVGQRYGFLKGSPEGDQDTELVENPIPGSRSAQWIVPTRDTKAWLLGTLR